MRLTLAIPNYNAERFVGEAIDGAFAQTYPELDIIISDDCSTDRSWDIIRQKVASYKGPHRILLNRNEKNLGLAGNINRLFEMCRTDWIALQGGDDISMPERIAKIAEAVKADPTIRCLHCRCDVIDADGNPFAIPESFKRQRDHKFTCKLPAILGAGAAYHRDVYFKFGPLAPFCRNEDHALPLRASLLGTIQYLEDPLVRYRKHDSNASGAYTTDSVFNAKMRLNMVRTLIQSLADLCYAEQQEIGDSDKVTALRRNVEDEIFIQRFLGGLVLHPERKATLLRELVGSPHYICLFVKRLLGRMLRK